MSSIIYHHFYQNSYIVKNTSISEYIDGKFIRVVCETINGVRSTIGYVTADIIDHDSKFVLSVLRETNIEILADSKIASVDYVDDIFLSSECEFYRQIIQSIENYKKMSGDIPIQISLILPYSSDDLDVLLAWLCDKDDLKWEEYLISNNLHSIWELVCYFKADIITVEVLKSALARFNNLEKIENMKKRMEKMSAKADAEIEKDKKRLEELISKRELKERIQLWLEKCVEESNSQ
ncbi:13204_t:CDS:1 [Ambispora gerdemannii]|uniref:13204_t:CDS:1 n=1 Tax=Ambispora gerdemannii TaxID=144530 RepID=A0A9N9CXL4_9GLOM|nr:13204_t:CDS:1 [Ambispora gerdemannii]